MAGAIRWIAGTCLVAAAAACVSSPPEPVLLAVVPGIVSNLAPSTVTLHGRNFLNDPTASIDQGTGSVDRGWKVLLDSTSLAAVQWQDVSDLTATVPPGFTPGEYGVRVISPAGRTAFLSSALTVTSQSIDYAPEACFIPGVTSGTAAVTTFTFDASCTTDQEDPGPALEVRWSFRSLVAGSWDTAFATTKTVSLVYPTAGTWTVSMEVRDSAGWTDVTSHLVTVYPAGGEVVVTTALDENDAGATPASPGGTGLSLREAINYVNTVGTPKVVRFADGIGTITLTVGVLPALAVPGASIVGRPGVTVDLGGQGSANSACLAVTGSNEIISWMTLTNCGGYQTVRLAGSADQIADSVLTLGASNATVGVGMLGLNDRTGPGNDISGFTYNQSSEGVYFQLSPAPGTHLVEGNRIHGNHAGVVSGGYSGSIIQRNLIYGNASNGITLLNGENAAVIRSNVIDGNGGDGIHLGNTSNHDVRDNIISNNGGYGITGMVTFLDPNGWFGNVSGAIKGGSPGPSSVTTDPLYVDPAAFDFRLQPLSPCINRGVDLGMDLNGLLPGNFNGSAPDLGAIETPY